MSPSQRHDATRTPGVEQVARTKRRWAASLAHRWPWLVLVALILLVVGIALSFTD